MYILIFPLYCFKIFLLDMQVHVIFFYEGFKWIFSHKKLRHTYGNDFMLVEN